MIKDFIWNIINSDWIKFVSETGWVWALLVSTKIGNNILSWLKHCLYCIKNPPIVYSANFNFEFEDVEATQINSLVKSIYKNQLLQKYKLKRDGYNSNKCNLRYPGIDYILEVEERDNVISLMIRIKETESNYNNLNNNIKNIIIGSFLKEIVLAKILETYTTTQFTAKYQFNLKFPERKYNFFLKERFANIPKGYVSNALVTIKDIENQGFILEADLNGINICVKDDFDKFLKIFSKYIAIV